METTPVAPPEKSKVTPKDFFLWAGAMVSLYVAVTSLITLLFEYINFTYPDALASYGDPYSTAIRLAMAAIIVLTPTTLALFYFIRKTIETEPGKAEIWVRKWVLMFTLFVAGATVVIDLITLVNYFLMGEITVRFGLKVAVVLLIGAGVFMHFLADIWGYWITQPKRAFFVGIGVGILAIASVVAGFFIIGSPMDVRSIKFDEQKTSDLQNIQYQVVNYWQQKQELPATLSDINDPLSSYMPNIIDPQSKTPYEYKATGKMSFELCADFNKETQDMAGKGGYGTSGRDVAVSYPTEPGGSATDNWYHAAGHVCYARTIDPKRYPPIVTPVSAPGVPAKGL